MASRDDLVPSGAARRLIADAGGGQIPKAALQKITTGRGWTRAARLTI
jgi:hypothetical protein